MQTVSRFLVLFASLLALSFTAPLQADDPPSRFPYRALTWSDFRIDDNAPGMAAQTRTYISFRYAARTRRDGSGYRAEAKEVTFEGGFDRTNSWRRSAVKTDNVRLLVHEQGHLDINEIHLRRLKSLPLSSFPTAIGSTVRASLSALDEKLKAIYEAEVKALSEEQKRYDAETKNGTLPDAQQEWEERFIRELSK